MIISEQQYNETIKAGGPVTQAYGEQEFKQCPVCRCYVWTGIVVKPGGKWDLRYMMCHLCADKKKRELRLSSVGKKYHCKISFKVDSDEYNECGCNTTILDFEKDYRASFEKVLDILHRAGCSMYAFYRGPGEMFANPPYGFRYGKGKKWIVKQRWGRDV